jgi:hypothetical protein
VGDHPVKVPNELVSQWWEEAVEAKSEYWPAYVGDRAAQWAADQELEACIKWFDAHIPGYELVADRLRAARRPKPPTLAEQAKAELDDAVMRGDCVSTTDAMPFLRAALNRLAELEANQ